MSGELSAGMRDWFESSLGRFLLAQESQRCRELVPSGYYPSSLQAGRRAPDFLAPVETGGRFYLDAEAAEAEGGRALPATTGVGATAHRIIAKPSAMPFADKTHNLIVLPHTLDFCDDPHAVLREVSHILAPQGCVVITGFNQLSLWGVLRLLMKAGAQRTPWNGHYRRVGQVQDWLSLLGFDLVGAGMLAYLPPLQNEKWRRQLDFLEQAGARWWPGLGAVYVIVGRKRETALTAADRGARLRWRRLLPGVAQPAAQNSGARRSRT